MGSLGFTWVHLGSLGFSWVHLGSLVFTLVHLGSLGFIWVDLVGSGRLGIKWVILEAQERLRQTDGGFLRCTGILSDLIRRLVNVDWTVVKIKKHLNNHRKTQMLLLSQNIGTNNKTEKRS